MSEQPLVSIIIPMYQASEFASRSITSVISQSYPAKEIIVVNDGSTDRTQEVIDLFPEIVSVVHDKRMGVATARNSGVRKAKGGWIYFLDADDECLPNAIERLVDFSLNNKQASAITGRTQYIREGKPITYPKKTAITKVNGSFDLLRYGLNNCISVGSVLIEKDALQSVGGFQENLKIGEDIDLWLRLDAKYGWFLIQDVILRYNCVDSSATWVTDFDARVRDLKLVWSDSSQERYNASKKQALFAQARSRFIGLEILSGMNRKVNDEKVRELFFLDDPPYKSWTMRFAVIIFYAPLRSILLLILQYLHGMMTTFSKEN
jgi:glycosyltransferase involved in cell wall biosynthesis